MGSDAYLLCRLRSPSVVLVKAFWTTFVSPRCLGRRIRLGVVAKYDQDFPDALHGVGGQRTADFAHQVLACAAIVTENPDLDELVAFEGQVKFPEDAGREARLTDHHDGMQMMRARPKRAPLGWRQFLHVRES